MKVDLDVDSLKAFNPDEIVQRVHRAQKDARDPRAADRPQSAGGTNRDFARPSNDRQGPQQREAIARELDASHPCRTR